ncbi:SDR family oxidoreductase [Runella salmonicolor]|uniref:SDR family NAD(P)-dependent oxidoreductase n=1 Tax=Runella salmonicolor TaxID=2950278 RepID=A0ABT1FNM2_9BACT|nr:SDR family NAD(P)-dependent oxidoreductase [Runella salmonicolor]MCP1383332.1 SDR family NAD(P)-dependent oxidoreductase [Runella salmonicolor]
MNPLVIVSSGTKGIGKATVERFMAGGFDVVTCARTESDLLDLQRSLQAKYPSANLYVKAANMAAKAEVEAFVTFIAALNRPVEIIVNNAGLFVPGQIHEAPAGTLEQMMEINLYSAHYLTGGLVEGMKERKKGHIFTLCSTASITAYPNGGAYCVAKFALYGFTKVLREELKTKGIRVTAILPGATFTSSWEGVELPPERFIKAEDIAEAIWSAYHLSAGAVVEEILIRPQLGDIV